MADPKQRLKANPLAFNMMDAVDTMIGDEKEKEIIEKIVEIEVIPANALLAQPDGSVLFGSYTLTTKGLVGGDDADEVQWRLLGKVLKKMEGSIQWLIGDWCVQAERKWGATYDQIAAETGYKKKSLREYAYVARSVDLSIRMDNLSFGHHHLVAGLSPDKQQTWLRKALSENWSISQLRKAIDPPAPQSIFEGDAQRANMLLQHVEGKLNDVEAMLPEKRREYIEHARWLVERYSNIIEWAEGLE